jgi:hypothetical protein
MSEFARYLDAELNRFLSREAQFGGRGGHPQPWMTGFGVGSLGHERRTGPGGQNNFAPNMSLDSIMGRTRRNLDDADIPDINMERWLEGSHSDVESDRRGYDLSPEERQMQNTREKMRRREMFLDSERNPEKPVDVPKKFKDGSNKEQHQTLESTLEHRHENDGKEYSDQASPQIQPTRTFGYASTYQRMLRLATKSIFDQNKNSREVKRTHTSTEATPVITSNEEADPMSAEEVSKKMPALGKMTTTLNPGGIPTSRSDFERAIDELALDDAGKSDLGMHNEGNTWGERTLTFDLPAADEVGDHSGSKILHKDMLVDMDSDLDAFLSKEPDESATTLEEQLEKTRPKRKFRLQDTDQVDGFSETEAKHLTDPNFPHVPWGLSDYYNGGAFADHGVPLPKI